MFYDLETYMPHGMKLDGNPVSHKHRSPTRKRMPANSKRKAKARAAMQKKSRRRNRNGG